MIAGQSTFPENRVHDARRVLVVDDSKSNRLVFSLSVTAAHYRPVVLASAERLMAEFQSDVPIAAVVLDMNMPGMGGLQAIEKIRGIKGNFPAARTPIIAVTADVSDELERAAEAAGADVFLTTPIAPSRLRDTIIAEVARHEAAIKREAAKVVSIREIVALRDARRNGLRLDVLEWIETMGDTAVSTVLLSSVLAECRAALERARDAQGACDVGRFLEQVFCMVSTTACVGGVGIRSIYEELSGLQLAGLKEAGELITTMLEAELIRLERVLDSVLNCDVFRRGEA